jgi:hypothetical protein
MMAYDPPYLGIGARQVGQDIGQCFGSEPHQVAAARCVGPYVGEIASIRCHSPMSRLRLAPQAVIILSSFRMATGRDRQAALA